MRRPDTRPSPGLLESLGASLLLAVFLWLIQSSNVFGIGEAISRQSERVTQRVMASIYGSGAKQHLAVLLYTDRSASLGESGWPMPMDQFAYLIGDIANANANANSNAVLSAVAEADTDETETEQEGAPPTGLFIDIIFRSADHDEANFCHLISYMSTLTGLDAATSVNPSERCLTNLSAKNSDDSGRHTWLALWRARESWRFTDKANQRILLGAEGYESAVLDELAHLAANGFPILTAAPLAYLNPRNAYRDHCLLSGGDTTANCTELENAFLAAAGEWPGVAWLDLVSTTVAVAIGADNGRSVHLTIDDADHPSAPWLIAKHLAGQKRFSDADGNQKGADIGAGLESMRAKTDARENLYTQWGTTVDSKQEMVPVGNCLHPVADSESIGQHASAFSRNLLNVLLPLDREQKGTRCPYHLTLDEAAFTSQSLSYEQFQELIANRFVFYGLDMARFSDEIDSPVHGILPAVYNHMMATDNLLVDGKDYNRSSVNSGIVAAVLNPVFEILLIALASCALSRGRSKLISWYGRKLRGLTTFFIGCCLLVLIALILAWAEFRLPNAHWWDYLASVSFATAFLWLLWLLVLLWGKSELARRAHGFFVDSDADRDNLVANYNERAATCLSCIAPHMVALCVLFAGCVLIAIIFSVLFNLEPFNTLSVFYAVLSVYLIKTVDDFQRAFSLILPAETSKDLVG